MTSFYCGGTKLLQPTQSRGGTQLEKVGASTRINGCKRRLKLAATGFKTGPGLSLNNELGFNLKVILYKRYLHQVRSKNL
jgi:hypothetical protein